MKKAFVCTWLSLLLCNSSNAQALQYPTLRAVDVHASIAYDGHSQSFYYSYSLRNDPANTGRIEEFKIDISRKPGTLNLDTVGLRFENDGFIEASFRRHFPLLKGKITPVGLLASPGHSYGFTWTGEFSDDLTAGWGADSAMVEPGQSLSGFEMMSKGLPGFRECMVSPFFDVDSLFPDLDDPDRTLSIAQMDSIREAVKFHGWTVGPTAPPADFNSALWLDTLLSYTRQSANFGWLGKGRDNDCDHDERPDDGIVKNIELRLQKAKRELVKGDSVQTRKELEKLVQKVERIWKRSQKEEKKHKRDRWEKDSNVIMTSEAYALLKYNTEYLIDQLPEKSKHGRDDDKDKKHKK